MDENLNIQPVADSNPESGQSVETVTNSVNNSGLNAQTSNNQTVPADSNVSDLASDIKEFILSIKQQDAERDARRAEMLSENMSDEDDSISEDPDFDFSGNSASVLESESNEPASSSVIEENDDVEVDDLDEMF